MVLYLLVADFWLSCKKIFVRYLDFTPGQLEGKSHLKSNNEYFQKEKLLEIVDQLLQKKMYVLHFKGILNIEYFMELSNLSAMAI